MFIHDQLHDRLPKSFSHFFKINTNNTRQKYKLLNDRSRTTFSSNLPKHCFPNIWNSLSDGSRDIQNRNQFKNTIKSIFITNYQESVQCTFQMCPDCLTKCR